MTQTLLTVVLFVVAIAGLPWLVRKLQQRNGGSSVVGVGVSRVLSAVSIGPQQRVVTVEVGPENARTCLVLGVTAQNVTCLHVIAPLAQSTSSAVPVTAFSQEMASALRAPETSIHG